MIAFCISSAWLALVFPFHRCLQVVSRLFILFLHNLYGSWSPWFYRFNLHSISRRQELIFLNSFGLHYSELAEFGCMSLIVEYSEDIAVLPFLEIDHLDFVNHLQDAL